MYLSALLTFVPFPHSVFRIPQSLFLLSPELDWLLALQWALGVAVAVDVAGRGRG